MTQSTITREEAKQAITGWLSEHVALRAAVIGRVNRDKYEAILRLALEALEDAARYEQAIRWALGEDGEFAMWPGYDRGRRPADGLSPRVGYFWWRTELRQRAAIDSALAAQDGPR